jgi:hypothetical protein
LPVYSGSNSIENRKEEKISSKLNAESWNERSWRKDCSRLKEIRDRKEEIE